MNADPGSPFRALEQGRAFQRIIIQIEEAILSGALRPGDRLPAERELAETFHVSRASVREALRVLESFGVVAARVGNGPNSGSTIADNAGAGITNAFRLLIAVMQISTEHIVDVRMVLEAHAVRLASRQATPHQLQFLHKTLDDMRVAQSPDEFHAHDTNFHVGLARASGNELLPVMMESLRGVMRRDMLEGYGKQGDWTQLRAELLRQHHCILRSVEAGDADGSAELVTRHIQHFYP